MDFLVALCYKRVDSNVSFMTPSPPSGVQRAQSRSKQRASWTVVPANSAILYWDKFQPALGGSFLNFEYHHVETVFLLGNYRSSFCISLLQTDASERHWWVFYPDQGGLFLSGQAETMQQVASQWLLFENSKYHPQGTPPPLPTKYSSFSLCMSSICQTCWSCLGCTGGLVGCT